jgi:hypothetical protein
MVSEVHHLFHCVMLCDNLHSLCNSLQWNLTEICLYITKGSDEGVFWTLHVIWNSENRKHSVSASESVSVLRCWGRHLLCWVL